MRALAVVALSAGEYSEVEEAVSIHIMCVF